MTQTRTEMDLEVMSGTWKAVKPSSMEGAMRIRCMSPHSQGRTVGGGKWTAASRPTELVAQGLKADVRKAVECPVLRKYQPLAS